MWAVLRISHMGVLCEADAVAIEEGVYHLLSHVDLGRIHWSHSADHPDISEPPNSLQLAKLEMSIGDWKNRDKRVFNNRKTARTTSDTAISGLQPRDNSRLNRRHVLPLPLAQGRHQYLRGSQHPFNLGLSGKRAGQDAYLVYVHHQCSPAPHGG